MKMGRRGVVLSVLLSLLSLASAVDFLVFAQVANTPPTIVSAEVERTVLYRGLQTLRGTLVATDKETPNRCARAITGETCLEPRYLKVEASITFSDFQTLRVPLVQPLDSSFNPTGPFALTVVIPSSVGTGRALLTLTVTDEGGLTNSTGFELTILDDGPVRDARASASITVSSASAVVAAAQGVGANVTSASSLLAEAREAFELGDVNLFSLEDVDAALSLYGSASAKASLATDAAQSSLRAFVAARDARERAVAAWEAASKQVLLAKSLGVDTREAEDLLNQASQSLREGDRLLTREGSPGAASAYARAAALAGFASDLVVQATKSFVEQRDAATAVQAQIMDVRLRLLGVRAELDSASAYLAALRAVGVDVSSADSLLKWASEALAKVEGELSPTTLASAQERAAEISAAIKRARDLATSAATKLFDDLNSRAKEALDSARGLVFSPDTSFASRLIESAADFRDRGELAAGIDRLKMALTEAGRLQSVSLVYNSIILATILVVLLAVILAAVLLRGKKPAQ
jgi:hypothetical protein